MFFKRKLTPAKDNPWYRLMTVHGEHADYFIDNDLHADNRRVWNRWAAQALSDAQKRELIDKHGFDPYDFVDLTEEDQAAIATRLDGLDCPEPTDVVKCRNVEFKQLCCIRFVFPKVADFQRATFSHNACFKWTAFTEIAKFEEAAFKLQVYFNGAIFSGEAYFIGAVFSGMAEFQDAIFKSTTSFESVSFNMWPPAFFNATLHEETAFSQKSFPKARSRQAYSSSHRLRYERLKLLMDSQRKYADEHFFLRKELECREVEEGFPANLPSKAFGLLSNYGWSLARPAWGALLVCLLGWAAIFADQPVYAWETVPNLSLGFWHSGAVSLSNTFGFLGLNRTFLRDELELLSPLSQSISVFQTVFGLILVFLFGLALRNRFRMK